MAMYDLDVKKGFFSKNTNVNITKFLKAGENIEFKHHTLFNSVKATVVKFNELMIRIQMIDEIDISNLYVSDYIVLDYTNTKNRYLIGGEIVEIENYPPYKIDIKIDKSENMKDLRKCKRYIISQKGTINLVGEEPSVECVIKNVSLNGIKINSRIDFLMDEIVELSIYTDKYVKFYLKGKVVRKNLLNEYFEYGLEIIELTESNLLSMHRYLNSFEF